KLEKEALDPSELEDEHAAALLALAERKRAEGRDVVEVEEAPPEDEEESAEVIDIMAVLKERVAGEGRRPAARATGARARERGGAKAADDLERKSKKELYEEAQKLSVPNRSKLTKEELIAAIRKAS